jgi:capsular polysaccharide biosynthesis protein
MLFDPENKFEAMQVSDHWNAIEWDAGVDIEKDFCEAPAISTIAFRGRRNYCHMLLEGLPRFAFSALWPPEAKPNTIWADGTIPDLVRDFAAAAGMDASMHFAPRSGVCAFSDLIISDAPKHPAHVVHPMFLEMWRSAANAFSADEWKVSRRIYIDRGSNRSASNKGELLELLARYGFESVRLETLSALEQISVFKDAEVVIGEHGAGLSSIVFNRRPQQLTVIEIMPSRYATPAFWILASGLGAKYCVVPEVGGLSQQSDPSVKREKVLVDLQYLESVLCHQLS